MECWSDLHLKHSLGLGLFCAPNDAGKERGTLATLGTAVTAVETLSRGPAYDLPPKYTRECSCFNAERYLPSSV